MFVIVNTRLCGVSNSCFLMIHIPSHSPVHVHLSFSSEAASNIATMNTLSQSSFIIICVCFIYTLRTEFEFKVV